jgi:hypothetical protein
MFGRAILEKSGPRNERLRSWTRADPLKILTVREENDYSRCLIKYIGDCFVFE